ncbi:MAG: HlyD family type I secretion periplasmic adaptor subunit [Filomicrobium sp.]
MSTSLKPQPDTRTNNTDWTSTDPWVHFGNRTVVFLVGSLLLFSLAVSISGAVIASGKVTVEGNYRSVQHPEGGTVKAIHAKNGDLVNGGQVLVSLDNTEALANLEIVAARVAELSIQEARLIAERDGKTSYALPSAIDVNNPEQAKLAAAQASLFRARRQTYIGEQAMLAERLKQAKSEMSAVTAELAARKSEHQINEDELANIIPLFKRGYVNRARLTPLKRESARLAGEVGRLRAQLSKLSATVTETRLRITQSKKQHTSEILEELSKVQAQLKEQREAKKKFAKTLRHTEIRAPHTGHVHALNVHTIGGVITPASQIALIIPQNERLMVTARLAPTDIDRVRVGQKADVQFPSFDARTTPRMEGKVTRISPAEQTDDQGRAFFTAEIGIAADELQKVGSAHPLVPGMPAEVFIETNYRSIMSYLLRPLTDSFSHAFRER